MNQKWLKNIILIVIIVIVVGVAGYFIFFNKPSPAVSKYTYYTFEEAGIPDDFDIDSSNLAYVKTIVKRDDKLFVTIDPVHIINCRELQNEHKTLPAVCPADPNHAIITDTYPIETDKTTQTLEMLPSAGPFFYSSSNGIKMWRTTDINTSQAILDKQIMPTDSTFSQITLFHVIQQSGKVTKIIEKPGA
jgi:hypothetical protein